MKRSTTFLMAAGVLLLGSTAMAGAPKVDICHIPPGNPGNPQSISVGPAAVAAHLAHGDTIGQCRGCEPVSDLCNGSIFPCGANCACAPALDDGGGVCIEVSQDSFPCSVTAPCPDGFVCINPGGCIKQGFGLCEPLCTGR
ncbi:MAG: hypothetical protein ACRERC_17075 [Candidatus Binatia bacterium]